MDRVNLEAMLRRAPAAGRERAALFLPFVGISEPVELPDPYYGQTRDFQRALDLARDGIMALRDASVGHNRGGRRCQVRSAWPIQDCIEG